MLPPLRAAQYVRMSTEHRQYSTENQSKSITEYAPAHGMVIVRTFSDHGKSGLNLAGRSGLKRLLDEVANGPVDFEALLVYDVSRWIIADRHRSYTGEELLDQLRILLERAGHLSAFIIDEAEDMPSSSIYMNRFGSLPRAYTLIGWKPGRDYGYLEINRRIREQHKPLVDSIVEQLRATGAHVARSSKTDLLTINAEYTAALILARCRAAPAGSQRWVVRFDTVLQPDITIAARLVPGNDGVLDYYLLPSIADLGPSLKFATHNPLYLEVFRFSDLSFFNAIARRVSLEEAA